MITGAHLVIFTTDAERDRAFFRDVLEFPSVDAGGGWLIFGLPPAELAAHPAEQGGQHELYLMCDDVHGTVAELKTKGVEVARPISDEGFGLGNRNPTARRWRARPVSTAAPLAAAPQHVHAVTAMPAPMADVQARLRDFALAILGGAPSRELEPGPAPPLAEEGDTPPGRAGRTDRLIKRDVASRVEERTEELAQQRLDALKQEHQLA